MKPAFSTVACPSWTLSRVVNRAEDWGYLGVELRSFGYSSSEFACDPALTGPAKTRAMFDRGGVEPFCIATSIRFDEPVTPPIIGEIFADKDKPVRAAKGAIDLASRLRSTYVRVFAFEIIGRESRRAALSRICEGLALAADAARNSGVRLLIENGGSFNTAADLAEMIDRVANPLLAAAYNVPVAVAAGEDAVKGVNVLGDSACVVKLCGYDGGRPCALDAGQIPNRAIVNQLRDTGFDGWLVYEHPAAWLGRTGADAEVPLAAAARTLYDFMGRHETAPTRSVRQRV